MQYYLVIIPAHFRSLFLTGFFKMIRVNCLRQHGLPMLSVLLLMAMMSAGCGRDGAAEAASADTATPVPTAAMTAAVTPSPTATGTGTPTAVPLPTATITPTATTAMVTAADTSEEGEPQSGIDVYLANYCGLCHTLTAAGTTGIFGPVHDGIGRVAEERIADPAYKGRATTPAEYIYESLVDPRAFVANDYKLTRHPMPAFTHLSEEDLNTLVALLVAQK